MKQIAETSPCLASEGLQSSVMGIDPRHAARITKYLRDSIYSDKILATVRETVMNSQDEHLKFEIDRPVSVLIKKEDNGYLFSTRDYAEGLNEQDIREVFGMYGSSKKRETNTQAGQYGVGSLAAFSYSDTFFVVSHFEGIKTTYSCILGGDEENISVGHIYKIDECPTTESGLEVSVPVKSEDLSKFSNKITDFVSLSPYNIEADILGAKVSPVVPTSSKKVGDYTFRCVPYSGAYVGKVLFQMGGNTYKNQVFKGIHESKIKDGHCLVIDIPIGHCSITLSREGFEETTKNDKVFSEIQDILNNLAEDDLSQFRTKSILDLVKDSLSEMKVYAGDFFQAYASNIYAQSWAFARLVQPLVSTLPIEEKNGKPICVIIPNNEAKGYWTDKVRNYLKESGRSLYVVKANHNWQPTNQEIVDSFELICARKLPYPKVKKADGRFTVYRRNSTVGKFNALEFFNHISREEQWNFEAKTEKEATDYLAVKISEVKTLDQLRKVAVRYTKSHDSYVHAVGSSAFYDKLGEIGFVKQGDITWNKIWKEIHEKENQAQEKERTLSSVKKRWLSYGPNTLKAAVKIRNAERINKFWTEVFAEDSLRSKIVKRIGDSYYGSSPLISRDELRKILALK